MKKVTVITASVGNPLLAKCIRSVENQTYENVQHLIVADGHGAAQKVRTIFGNFDKVPKYDWNVLNMPYSIGKDRWNGHRIYAAGAFQAEGEFIIYLDDDNYLDPTHIEDCLRVIEAGNDWAFSFRKIMDAQGNFLCHDNCESLGKWASVMDPRDFFIDVNCYFLPTTLAIHLGPAWYRKFREPGKPEVDRVLAHTLMNNGLKYDTTYKYSVGYTVGNTPNSVQIGFFEKGNAEMLRRFDGVLPWTK